MFCLFSVSEWQYGPRSLPEWNVSVWSDGIRAEKTRLKMEQPAWFTFSCWTLLSTFKPGWIWWNVWTDIFLHHTSFSLYFSRLVLCSNSILWKRGRGNLRLLRWLDLIRVSLFWFWYGISTFSLLWHSLTFLVLFHFKIRSPKYFLCFKKIS